MKACLYIMPTFLHFKNGPGVNPLPFICKTVTNRLWLSFLARLCRNCNLTIFSSCLVECIMWSACFFIVKGMLMFPQIGGPSRPVREIYHCQYENVIAVFFFVKCNVLLSK